MTKVFLVWLNLEYGVVYKAILYKMTRELNYHELRERYHVSTIYDKVL